MNQIGALFASSATHQTTVEHRLLKLSREGYIALISKPRAPVKEFKLLQKGMNELVNAELYPKRRVRSETPSELFRDHDFTTSDITVSMELTARDFYEPVTLIDQHTIYARAHVDPIRANHGWRISVSHPDFGKKDNLFVRPDKLTGVHFSRRPVGRNQRFYVIETNMGKMPLRAPLYERSILRKLLVAEKTFTQNVLARQYGVQHPYFLFFFPTKKKRDNAIHLATEYLRYEKAANSILFAVFPTPPIWKKYTDMSGLEFFNAKGEQACLRM